MSTITCRLASVDGTRDLSRWTVDPFADGEEDTDAAFNALADTLYGWYGARPADKVANVTWDFQNKETRHDSFVADIAVEGRIVAVYTEQVAS